MGKRKNKKQEESVPTGTVIIHPPKIAPAPAAAPTSAGAKADQQSEDSSSDKRHHKDKIPKAVREQLWVRDIGEKFYGKCKTSWCANRVSVFDFQCGHNVPESKGGPTTLENMVVLCSRCNNSMSNNYTFDEWQTKYQPKTVGWRRYFCGF